jgi:hypothetical protein
LKGRQGESSERTRARFKATMERFAALGATPEQLDQALTDAPRQSGTLKVHLLDRDTRWLLERRQQKR